ncbi:hypothetical protein CEN44_22050 [Fischerella muscicola CCMEE 5323]|uniref:CopG family transcriptional regulator n=1 Tax=Fischerella muscicola CCMEE 5323 TaxID=2019572 RepID=A0A2N6JY01_FISMU|nr:hypothetical protein CEN44_22050 [Fischerella muscicola CCMEE 5323]
MKPNSIRIRLSDRRLNKLRLYAAHTDKTMTQVVEELIDSLPSLERDKQSADPVPASRQA